MKPKLLIVDDGDRYVELAHRFLRDYAYATRCELDGPCWTCERRAGCTLTHAHDAREAADALERHPDVDVVLLDVAFELDEARLVPAAGDLERRRRLQGLDILAQLRRARGELPVVLMTSEEELRYEDAAEALAVDEFVTLAGADAFDARALGLLVERVLARRRDAPAAGGYLWGRTASMARVRRDALTLSRTSLPVLLLGETGTGKSALAEHVLARRGPFVSVDLSAIPPTLVAAELFGTARGAFSGAVERAGRFERAHGGTLLLDEIGSLPPEAQRMLLLALEEKQVTRLGENTPRPVDVKLVAATNADLQAAVRAGTFRADLLARLNPAARIVLPPLRERLADLEELLGAFVQRTFASGADRALLAAYLDAAKLAGPPHAELALGRAPPPPSRGVAFAIAPATIAALRAHAWPGNVRELGLLAASAAVFALADALRAVEEGRAPSGQAARTIPIPAKLVRDLVAGSWESAAVKTRGAAADVEAGATLRQVAQELERKLYAALYKECGGDFTAMAKRLLHGNASSNARRVRLRFNQLGLRIRESRKG
ncbi:MAG TPA: sigma 54-interacting transcriptional regulator [Polyangia bacterium]|nr:sigma 54-interacting transcriptional regulator [Polyangia bacterium]